MPGLIRHKRGDSFSLRGTVRLNGVHLNISGWQVQAQLQRQGKLVASLEAAIDDPEAGRYIITHSGSQAAWPLGELQLELQYTNSLGEKQSMPSSPVIVESGVL